MSTSNLKIALDTRKAAWSEKASDEIKRIYGEGIADVVTSGILQQAKQVGDMAPGFSLRNATGKSVLDAEYRNRAEPADILAALQG